MWMLIGIALAGLTLVLPWRWAVAIAAFVFPFTGTVVGMLGGNPLLVSLVVALFLILRHAVSLLQRKFREQFLQIAAMDVIILSLLAYAVVSGIVFPRLFAGVTTIHPSTAPSWAERLGPHHVNLPQVVYLILGVYIYLALRHVMRNEGPKLVALAVLWQASVVGSIGLLQAVLGIGGVQLDLSWIANNQGYAMLQDSAGGFTRVSAVFPEASAYAGWGVGALAYSYMMFISGAFRRLAFYACAVLALSLVLSTSTTAYFGLACLTLAATVHLLVDPSGVRRARAFGLLAAAACVGAVIAAAVMMAEDGPLEDFRIMVVDMTIEKGQSASGQERGRWAESAFLAGLRTYGLGAGHGTMYSSGLLQSLFGTIGAIGLLLYLLFVFRRISSVRLEPRTLADATAAAGGFGLALTVMTGLASAAGLTFASMEWIYAAIAATFPAAFQARARPIAAPTVLPGPAPTGWRRRLARTNQGRVSSG